MKVLKITQSPMNAFIWCVDLECGHEQWVTSKTHPRRKNMDCPKCHERSVEKLQAELDRARKALTPFVKKFDTVEALYRKRGGDPDKFHDAHPSFEVTAREFPLSIWRRARDALKDQE